MEKGTVVDLIQDLINQNGEMLRRIELVEEKLSRLEGVEGVEDEG